MADGRTTDGRTDDALNPYVHKRTQYCTQLTVFHRPGEARRLASCMTDIDAQTEHLVVRQALVTWKSLTSRTTSHHWHHSTYQNLLMAETIADTIMLMPPTIAGYCHTVQSLLRTTAQCSTSARTMPWSDVRPSVCLSVCLSVTRRCCVQTAKHIIKLFYRP